MNTFDRSFYLRPTDIKQEVPADAPAGTEVYYRGDGIVIAFTGKAQKPSLYINYRTPTYRADQVAQWLKNITTWQAEKDARREARKGAVCPYTVGQILHGSWGYDQTNCEFYEIIAVKGRKITLRECAHQAVPGSQGQMSQMVTPVINPEGEVITRIAQTSNGKDWYIRLSECCSLYEHNGSACYSSWYA